MKKIIACLVLGAMLMCSGCVASAFARKAKRADVAERLSPAGVKKLTADIMDDIHSTNADQILQAKREILERLLEIEIRIRRLEDTAR